MARNILNFVKFINVEIHEAVQTTTRVNSNNPQRPHHGQTYTYLWEKTTLNDKGVLLKTMEARRKW